MIKPKKKDRFERPSYFWLYFGVLVCLVVFILAVNTAFSVWLPTGHHNQIERMTTELVELKSENNKQFLRLVRLRAEAAEMNDEAIVYKKLIKEIVLNCE